MFIFRAANIGVRYVSGGDYTYVNPPKVGAPGWGELLDKGSNSIILGEIGELFLYHILHYLILKRTRVRVRALPITNDFRHTVRSN